MDALLNKASTKDDNPTPGYVYTELSKLTHVDATTCDKMADWLYKKLKVDDARVKWKVLLVMKQVARTGRMDFRNALKKNNQQVKDCQAFKGPPDPLRGDEPYRRVRDAAKEALDAMFDSTMSASSAAVPPALPPAISGGGGGASRYPPPAGGGSGPTSSLSSSSFSTALPGQPGYDPNSPLHAPPVSSGLMQGFGNYDPARDQSTASLVFNKMKSAFTTSTTVPPSGAAAATQPYANPGGGSGMGMGGSGGASRFPPATGGGGGSGGAYPGAAGSGAGFGSATGDRRPGQPGGGWGSPAGGAGGQVAPSATGGFGRRAVMPAGGSGGDGVLSSVGGGARDGSYERSLVEDLTAPGGVRANPDREKLAAFLAAARTLDTALIGRLLDERLVQALPDRDASGGAGGSVAVKALFTVEALASAPGCETLKGFLSDHCDVVLDIVECESVKPSTRVQALRILRALGVEGVVEPPSLAAAAAATAASAAAAAPTYQPQAPVPAAAAAPHVYAPAPAAAPAAPAVDLLGMDFSGGAAATTAAPAAQQQFVAPVASAVPWGAAPAAAAPAPVASTLDMFGGMSLGGAPQVAPTPAPAAAAAPPAAAAASGGALQAQLLTLQQSIASVTNAMAANPASQGSLLPQLIALQQQQTAIVMAMASAATAGAGGAAPLQQQQQPMQQQPQQAAWGVPQQQQQVQQPWMQQAAAAQQPAVGGFSFLASPPPAAPAAPMMTAGALGTGFALNGRAAPAAPIASPAPAAPKPHDPFGDLTGGLFST